MKKNNDNQNHTDRVCSSCSTEIDSLLSRPYESLTPLEVELLTEPMSETEESLTIPIQTEDKSLTLFLTVQQKRKCYFAKATHEYEAFVTQGSKNGPRYTVDKIDLHISRDKDLAQYIHTCTNTSWCPKTDKVYFTGNACGLSKVWAEATHRGFGTWRTGASIIR